MRDKLNFIIGLSVTLYYLRPISVFSITYMQDFVIQRDERRIQVMVNRYTQERI